MGIKNISERQKYNKKEISYFFLEDNLIKSLIKMAYKWGLYNNKKELVISIRKRLNRIYNYNKGSRKLQLINKLIVLMK